MARADDLKANLAAYVEEQKAALVRLDAQYQTEKVRLEKQIDAATTALVAWDRRVDALINALGEAGIPL